MTDSDIESRTDPLSAPKAPGVVHGRKAPVPKRKKPGPYRVPPRSKRQGLLIVNTGNGKGKTTAALGLLLRAHGRRLTVGMFQFVNRMPDGGEHRAARRLGVDIIALGVDSATDRVDAADEATLAREGWARCRALLASGTYDVIILDEITLPITWGWLDEAEVIAAVRARAKGTHVVMTGRDATPALIAAADLVTEMREIKHPYRTQQLRAQAGIDV